MAKVPTRRNRSYRAPSDRQIRQGVRLFAELPARAQRVLLVCLAVLLLVCGLYWLGGYGWDVRAALRDTFSDGGQTVSTGFDGSGVETYGTASQVLDTLTVAEPSAPVPYRRDKFGQAWADIDSNGCDQRNDILTRDLQEVQLGKYCLVLSGQLLDPYTAHTISFTRGPKSSEEVPIDHVVALSNAWASGAWAWDDHKRLLLANDPLNLQATGREPNTAKSDKSADAWLPQPGYRCEYAARQVSVKAAYHLTVSPAEEGALRQVLTGCPDQPAYRSAYAR